MMSKLLYLTALAAAATLTVASAPETIYLSNCVDKSGSGTNNYSEIDYYAAGHDSQNHQDPGYNNRCQVSQGNTVTWEGNTVTCKFPTGVTVTTHIQSNGQQVNQYSYAGYLSNGKTFNCYKDNYRQLYYPADPEGAAECSSIYYCLPA